MALANINYALNHTEDTAYIVIKNDQTLLEVLFNGLFVVARRHLGFSPRASSYPFMTRATSERALKVSKHEREDLDYAMKHKTVITPDAQKHGKNEVLTLIVSGHIDFIKKAIVMDNQTSEPDCKLDYTDANVNNVYQALIEDYWDEMLAFAKDNRNYLRNWQSYRKQAA